VQFINFNNRILKIDKVLKKIKKPSDRKILNEESAMGYVESLISLVVAGIACVALLSVASAVIREAAKNETRDAMTQYSVEGLERVRLVADADINLIPVPSGSTTEHYCLDDDPGCDGDCIDGDCSNGRLPFHKITNESSLCSQDDEGDGECGQLSLKSGGDPLMYREIDITKSGCGAVEVVVRVGFLQSGRNNNEADAARETEVRGYIGGVDVAGCTIGGVSAACNPPCGVGKECVDGICYDEDSCQITGCNAHSTCSGDDCVCNSPWADCDGNFTNGCETDTNSSTNHCGSCNSNCAGTCDSGTCIPDPVCRGGAGCNSHATCTPLGCVCDSPYKNCDGNWNNGCEVNLLSDESNCGSCGNECGTGEYCSVGSCRVPSLPSSCFIEGTEILMADGTYKEIQDIEIGEEVTSFDLEDKRRVISEVREIESPNREGYYLINKDLIGVTNEHPFRVRKSFGDIGWASIEPEATLVETYLPNLYTLKAGDFLLNENNEWVRVLSIEYIEGSVQTYNLKSVDWFNFYANGFLVHNKNEDIIQPPPHRVM
jgi:hypothetical protein